METYPTIKINNKEYYWANDKHNIDKSLFIGCRNNIRNIIDKKNINEKDHVFAYDKEGKLIISNIKYCKAKLYLSKDWCVNNVPNLSNDNKEDKLPPKVNLEEDQVFIDSEGNKSNITMRGERSYDKCYFKVEDISEIFEMKSLKKNILDKNTKYMINKHYKIFTCTNPQKMGQ